MWELAFPVAPCLAVLVWCLRGAHWTAAFTRSHGSDTSRMRGNDHVSDIGRR